MRECRLPLSSSLLLSSGVCDDSELIGRMFLDFWIGHLIIYSWVDLKMLNKGDSSSLNVVVVVNGDDDDDDGGGGGGDDDDKDG